MEALMSTDPQDIPTEPGFYRDHTGQIWLLIPENATAGFYGLLPDGTGIVHSPWGAALETLRSLRPFTKVENA